MAENKETTATAGTEQPDQLTRIEKLLASMLEDKIEEGAASAASELAALAPAGGAATASLASRLTPRMLACLVLAGILAAGVALLSPAQVPVAAYKLALVSIAGYLGYWLDRWCFPYARPDSFLVAADWRADNKPTADRANNPVVPGCEQVYAAAMLRRALIMLATMLAMGLGL